MALIRPFAALALTLSVVPGCAPSHAQPSGPSAPSAEAAGGLPATATGPVTPAVMAAIRADRWAEAQSAASDYADPVVAKLVLYYRLLAPRGGTLAEIEAFRAAHPEWPQQATLGRRRDEALAAEPDNAAVVAACGRSLPATATALARCADAFAAAAQPDAAAGAARRAWIASPPDPVADAAFLPRWRPEIGPGEQWERFSRLAWSDPTGAGRQLGQLAPADRPAGEAWLALKHDLPTAEQLLGAVPAARAAEPGLVLEHVRWLRRAARDTDALSLWKTAGADAERAAPHERKPAFWDERNVLARRRLQAADAAGAYALAAGATQEAPEQVADATFLAGWIALRPLADPAKARTHFTALAALSPAVLTQSRAEYWLARAARAAGDEPAAERAFSAAAAFPGTFYGQLAAGDDAAVAAHIFAAKDPAWNRQQALALAGGEMARAAAWLVAWGETRRAQAFLLRLAETAQTPADLSLIAHLATGFAMPETAVAVARRAGRSGTVLLQAGWPVAAVVPDDAGMDRALALAVMRQESSFDSATVSPAGARGLMQLMPGTAAQIGTQLGVAAPPAALTADPALNIRLGTAYLRTVLATFEGAQPLAIAAYNAGPSRVTQWLSGNGDPRSGTPDMIDWIELIPFSETRNYVQRVSENVVVYRARLQEKPETAIGHWPRSPA